MLQHYNNLLGLQTEKLPYFNKQVWSLVIKYYREVHNNCRFLNLKQEKTVPTFALRSLLGKHLVFFRKNTTIPSILFNKYVSILTHRGVAFNSTRCSPVLKGFLVKHFCRTRRLAKYKSKVKQKKQLKLIKDRKKEEQRLKKKVYIKYKKPNQKDKTNKDKTKVFFKRSLWYRGMIRENQPLTVSASRILDELVW